MTTVKDWADALRSGKYEQGEGNLITVDGEYCCLGVLCDIVDPKVFELNEYGDPIHFVDGFGTAIIPDFVQYSVGWDIDNIGLAELNDGGFNFNEIADVIDYLASGWSEDELVDYLDSFAEGYGDY